MPVSKSAGQDASPRRGWTQARSALLFAGGLWCAGIVLSVGALGAALFGSPSGGLTADGDRSQFAGVTMSLAVDGPDDVRIKARRPSDSSAVPRWTTADSPGIGEDEDLVPGAVERVVHEVQPGETLTTIASGYLGSRSDWNEVAAANAISSPYVLQIGQKVVLPDVTVAKTQANLTLRAAIEDSLETTARVLFSVGVNQAPEDAFTPPEAGLKLSRPLRESFRWDVALVGVSGFVLALVIAIAAGAVSATRTANMRAVLASLGLGALAASGAAACFSWLALVLAEAAALRPSLQAVLACAFGLASAVAAFVGARDPNPMANGSAGVARRFAMVLGMVLTLSLIAAIAVGWAGQALSAIRLPS